MKVAEISRVINWSADSLIRLVCPQQFWTMMMGLEGSGVLKLDFEEKFQSMSKN